MVPEGWKLTTLGEVCNGQLQTGPFGSQLHADEYTTSGIAVLMPKDLVNHRATINSASKISPERAQDLKKHTLKVGDILFSRRGDVTRFALVDEGARGALCGTGCLKATPSEEHAPEFIAYFLQKDAVKRWLEQNSVGQTMPNMNTSILSELPLMTANSRQEEEKIAMILSTWDKMINTIEQLLANSQKQRKALIQQLITGKKRLVRHEKSLGYKITSHGEIPSDWEYPMIREVCSQISEKNGSGADYPVLSCSKHEGFVDSLKYFKKKVYSEDTSGYRVIPRGCFGFPANHIEEGSIGLQRDYDIGIVSPIYVVFMADEEKVNNEYLYALLKTEHYRQIFSAATNSSVDRRGSLRWKEFSSIHVPLPPLSEQNKIASALATADEEIEKLKNKLDCIKQEKKALMQQLLTGKRRVKTEDKEK
ncbi:restriction endonuclease subunit S [Halomonas sp.]|uniref:restriction endonuclease subunit S n=1 Tax=Halomonas sp. TaxID=1486246 RepID=UPI000C94EBF5|nr:restriction endonuclease subunit S [Halomonas sp.]MAR70851.1 type I restriction endonuclease subunit R [Halomonas sp.]|tara:strand:- start:15687 stop:16952 length:1266 start_codon:yes stop_codon:yes gene_type:complete